MSYSQAIEIFQLALGYFDNLTMISRAKYDVLITSKATESISKVLLVQAKRTKPNVMWSFGVFCVDRVGGRGDGAVGS